MSVSLLPRKEGRWLGTPARAPAAAAAAAEVKEGAEGDEEDEEEAAGDWAGIVSGGTTHCCVAGG